MKKPVKRAILLEDALSDLMEAEYILSAIAKKDGVRALTTKQRQRYNDVLSRLHALVYEVSQETAQEQSAA